MRRWFVLWCYFGTMSCGLFEPERHVRFKDLDAGGRYTCALDDAGRAFCWGGVDGYFGNAPHPDSVPPTTARPLAVPKSAGLARLTVGAMSKCALDSGRRAFCWGANQLGEVGDGSLIAKLSPSAVMGGRAWLTISSGGSHTCGVAEAHVAYCWGNEFRGALGNGGNEFLAWTIPTEVRGGLLWNSVYASSAFSCGITTTGDAYCWGANTNGSLGNGIAPASADVVEPSAVVGGLKFRSLALGGGHACGISQAATIYCWGTNTSGQIGIGTLTSTPNPTQVPPHLDWTQLALGEAHSCALTSDGSVYCWGANSRGQLGDGTTASSSIPRQVALPGNITAITAAAENTCALSGTGVAYCWGRGTNGQLGNGGFDNAHLPVQVIWPRR